MNLLRVSNSFALCLVVSCAIVASGSALAQSASWISPTTIGQSTGLGTAVALSDDGTKATAVWLRDTHANGLTTSITLESASATISGGVASWGSVTLLSPSEVFEHTPVLAMSSDGTKVVALWVLYTDKTLKAKVATVSGSTASWGPTQTIKTDAPPEKASVAISSDGTKVIAAWSRKRTVSASSGDTVVESASGLVSGNALTLGTTKKLSKDGNRATNPMVRMSADGTRATAVWNSVQSSTAALIRTASATVSGTTSSWGGVTDLSAVGFYSHDPQLALSSDGRFATVVWVRKVGGTSARGVRTRSARIDGSKATWGATTVLSNETDPNVKPLVALSSDGTTAVASWNRLAGRVFTLQSSSGSIQGETSTWGGASDILQTSILQQQNIGLSSDGTKALLLATELRAGKHVLQGVVGAIQGITSVWGTLSDVSDPTFAVESSVGVLSADGEEALALFSGPYRAPVGELKASVGTMVHPTPTPTPMFTSTPTATPTPAQTATPVATVSAKAPVPSHTSNDGRVVLRVKDYPNSFNRDYYGYLLNASDHKLVKFGKFRVRRGSGSLVFHVPSGRYVTFSVVFRSKAPKIVASRYRTITVK